jgi:hypothetical protein
VLLVVWLVGDHLLLRDLGPYGAIFIMCVCYFRFLVILDGKCTDIYIFIYLYIYMISENHVHLLCLRSLIPVFPTLVILVHAAASLLLEGPDVLRISGHCGLK